MSRLRPRAPAGTPLDGGPPVRLTRWRPSDWPEYPDEWSGYVEWRRQVRAWMHTHGGTVGRLGGLEVWQLLSRAHHAVPPPPEVLEASRRRLRQAFDDGAAALSEHVPSVQWRMSDPGDPGPAIGAGPPP